MRGLLLRHVLKRYLVLVGAVLAGLLVVFLVADFFDRAVCFLLARRSAIWSAPTTQSS